MQLSIKSVESYQHLSELYQKHSTFHNGDAGLDLFCPLDLTVPANAISFAIPLGIACSAKDKKGNPVSYYLYPRSSMGSKTSLRLCNSVGIIDSGYRGQIIAFVDNISNSSVHIRAGERYFQLCAPNLGPITCQIVEKLDETERNSGGFGSTGK